MKLKIDEKLRLQNLIMTKEKKSVLDEKNKKYIINSILKEYT